jgi:hypothetical protein
MRAPRPTTGGRSSQRAAALIADAAELVVLELDAEVAASKGQMDRAA